MCGEVLVVGERVLVRVAKMTLGKSWMVGASMSSGFGGGEVPMAWSRGSALEKYLED